LKEGKRVQRQENWNWYLALSSDIDFRFIDKVTNKSINQNITLLDIEATDWQIYEEDNWNLADKQHPMNCDFNKDDIKTFIQKVKEDIENEKVPDDYKEEFSAGQYNNGISKIIKILDKRAGDLENVYKKKILRNYQQIF